MGQIFTMDIFDTSFIFRICKKNSYKSIQKAGSPIREMVLNKCVIQNIQMSNKHVENKFNFISYKDIHIKTTSHLLECV